MDKDRKEKLQERIIEALNIFKTNLNMPQKQVVILLDNYRKENRKSFATSESTLSKIRTSLGDVSEGALNQISKTFDDILEKYGYVYQETEWMPTGENIENIGSNSNHTDSVYLGNASMALEKFKGVYEVYQLDKLGKRILKNIIQIKDNGEVVKKGIHNHLFLGKAQLFLQSLLSIQFHQCQDYAFYSHSICEIGNYAQVGTDHLIHFFGICTSVTMDNEPMAAKQVWIKVSQNAGDFQQYHYRQIELYSVEFEKLNQDSGGLATFLANPNENLFVINKKVNDSFL